MTNMEGRGSGTYIGGAGVQPVREGWGRAGGGDFALKIHEATSGPKI